MKIFIDYVKNIKNTQYTCLHNIRVLPLTKGGIHIYFKIYIGILKVTFFYIV